MTFEEQLQRTFETVTARLRDEIARELQFVSVDVGASPFATSIARDR